MAYVPHSNHPVGAVIVDGKGDVYTGCNVEVAHYKGICAEGTAITQMVLNGGRKIKDIYVIGPQPEKHLCTPCGDCRQRIREFADTDTRIHCFSKDGQIDKTFTMDELLPCSFGPEHLEGL